MKYFLYMLAFVMCCINCVAQTYIEPVFDRADYPEYLHINKIEVTKDTTFVYCTYTAEAGSWARISKETYLYNSDTQEKFLLLQSRDLPFSPQKREFPNGGTYQILFSFSGIGNATKLNFIEDPNDEAFNIYGIDLTNTFDTSYSGTDLKCISDQSLSFDTAGDAIKAIQYKEEEKKATAFIYGTKSEQFLMVVYDLCRLYEKYGFNKLADDQKKKITDYIDTLNDNLEKWQLLTSLSNVFLYKNDYTKSLKYKTHAVDIGKKLFGVEHLKYATSLHELSINHSLVGNYEEAIRCDKVALNIQEQVLGTEHPNYATILAHIARYNSFLGNYEEAIQLGMKALEIRKRVLGTNHPDYAISLCDLATFYAELGNYKEAIRLGTEALETSKRLLGTEELICARISSDLATFYARLGNNKEAIRLGTEALEIWERTLGKESPYYSASLSVLATFYYANGNYEDAIRIGTQALENQKRIFGIEHPYYTSTLNNLAACYSALGNYEEAIQLGTEALEIRKRVLGTNHPDYASSLSGLATYYAHLGNYGEAIRIETEALEISKKILGTEHPDYAKSLNNLSVDYSSLGNYGEAIRLGKEALEIRKRILGTEHPDYATILDNLAGYYSSLGNYEEAIRLGTEALEIQKRFMGTEHLSYATTSHNLAGYYFELGNYSEAIQLGTEALEIRMRILGTEHPDYASSLSNLAGCYSAQGNHTEAYLSIQKSIEVSQSDMLRDFVELSSHLRETFWGKYKYIYNKALPSYVYKYENAESIAELYDKTCLFAKGLLLNSDIELRKLILESGDSILIDKYNSLSTNISIYNKLIEKPINERYMNADSLNNVIQQQEMELARESKVYGDYTRNLTSTWKDVRNHLGTDDIAIEFIDFPILGTDSVMYAALTLKKDYESPHMVTLFEKKQLMGIPDSTYYTRTGTYDLIWKPLEEELGNVHNIYFAPSGELHRIGIEYIPVSQTENISDKYSLHRLSSTRQLALIQDGTKGEQSILYGGINYDENTNATPHVSTSSVGGVRGANIIYRSNVDSLLLRSSYEYLEGTKREVDQIADQMKQHQIHYLYYSGADGSEESFKKLDGTKPKMLHIATHGFYLTEEEAKLSNFARPQMELMMGDNQRAGRPVEDKPMTRSGLLFSGCNHAIHHEPIPDGVEDGILTAQEISTLDLRGLDLVVLSACQTALGDIASGEGVFGLQRGFKKAGAKTILMSIDKVDDEATRILMVEFYNNLMSGKSKYQSLKDAQKYLREYDNRKYDNPKYWASFIMLD